MRKIILILAFLVGCHHPTHFPNMTCAWVDDIAQCVTKNGKAMVCVWDNDNDMPECGVGQVSPVVQRAQQAEKEDQDDAEWLLIFMASSDDEDD